MSTFRVEKHIIKNCKEIDNMSLCSKNLYNRANWLVRQVFINTSRLKELGIVKHAYYFNYSDVYEQIKKETEYKILPEQTIQNILKQLDKNWKSFFKSIKKWNQCKNGFTDRPSLPKYLNKKGRHNLIYPGQNLNIQKGYLKIPKTKIKIKTNLTNDNLIEFRITPLGNKAFKILITYEITLPEAKSQSRAAGCDLGMNNLLAITSNQLNVPSLLINGRPVKSINQYYNKQLAKLKSVTMIINNKYWSNEMSKLTLKRNCKIDDYFHKASRIIINFCIKHDIGLIVVGHNNSWKDKINLGVKTNQNFVGIPFNKLIEMLIYKGKEVGITVITTEESYTSKCDHLALEAMEHHKKYIGKRKKRGIFQSSVGKILNADINGSIGIMRKEKAVTDEFLTMLGNPSNGGLVFNPVLINC